MGRNAGRSPALQKADSTDLEESSSLPVWSCVLGSSLPVSFLSSRVPVFFWFSELLCCWSVEEVLHSRLGEWPVKGGTDGRCGSAGCVVDLRVRTRSAGEGSPAVREVGARRDHADGRGRGTHWPQKGSPFFSFGFLYACCGAVSNKLELPK